MGHEQLVEIIPSAAALIASLRGLGYSPETAIADLIDNSIAAGAEHVAVDIQWNEGSPEVAVADDGTGMDEAALASAFRLGGVGPTTARPSSDLGRFGLGLKTASLSQCRQMTVVSAHDGVVSALCLDVDVISDRGWVAVVPEPLPQHPFISLLVERRHGTVVFWKKMDALGGLFGLDRDSFFLRIDDVRAHLGMVFHRFLDGDARKISIVLNGRSVRAWDPFQQQNPAVTRMRTETLRHAGAAFSVKPFVLPHRDRFGNDAEYEAAGGPGGWTARQGFYVYRGKRLLLAGSWLGLGGTRAWTREESSRLARIAIDLPTNLDSDWRIDVRKSQARPPGAVRSRLTALAARCRDQAREVFAWRGQGVRRQSSALSIEPVWLADETALGTRYRINRSHPAVSAVADRSDPDLLNALLTLVERSVPVERIWLSVSDEEGAAPPVIDKAERNALVHQLLQLGKLLPPALSAAERADILVRGLPGETDILKNQLQNEMEGMT